MQLSPRRDWSETTPAFQITDADLALLADMLTEQSRWAPLSDAARGETVRQWLEVRHQTHCYRHRPVVGLHRSLDGVGFAEDWRANVARHMEEAYAEYQRVTAPARREAA